MCWAVIIAACVLEVVVWPPLARSAAPRWGTSHVLYIATTAALAVLLLGLLANRRFRVRLRIRPRLSRPSAHGAAYLEGFALKALLLVAALATVVHGALAADRDWYAWLLEAWGALPYLAAIGYVCVSAHSVRVPLAEWGWHGGHGVPRELSIGIVAGIVGWSARHLSVSAAGPDAIFLAPAVGTVLLAPILEETAYRGMLYRHLRDRLRWLPATLITATVFALFHSFAQMPTAYVGGLLYGLLREWRGSLISPVAAHASMNLLAITDAGAFN
jgi:membrane protease YdiL (CAAX protease family)